MTLADQYAWAGRTARYAMGKTPRRRGDTGSQWAADNDPLAWWLLTEALVYGPPAATTINEEST